MSQEVHTKLFKTGGSQAVRIPKEFRFAEDGEEVIIQKVGRSVIMMSRREAMRRLKDALARGNDDFPEREQPSKHQERDRL